MTRTWDRQWGRRLRAYRARRGLTQADFGAQVGVTKQTVSLWELGKYVPNRSVRADIKTMIHDAQPPVEPPPVIADVITCTIPLDGGAMADLTIPHPITRADVARLRIWLDLMEPALVTPIEADGT